MPLQHLAQSTAMLIDPHPPPKYNSLDRKLPQSLSHTINAKIWFSSNFECQKKN